MVIFDSSTLILLAKISLLDTFIANYSGKCVMPHKVKEEVLEGKSEEIPVIVKLIEDGKIQVLKIKSDMLVKKLMEDFNIDLGETEALALAVKEKPAIVATDDRNAIRACRMLKIDFISAMAVLIRAFEKNLITRKEAVVKLEKLVFIGRYKKTIIEDAAKVFKGGK